MKSGNPKNLVHDRRDPSPWLALALDQSVPMDEGVKNAYLRGASSPSRQYFLPLARPFARLAMGGIQVFRSIFPKLFSSSNLFHAWLVWALRTFVTPEGNYLLLRHFHLGTQVLDFLRDNVAGVKLETLPLRPVRVGDLRDHVFVQHDLNLYNFVIDLNRELRAKKLELSAKAPLDWSSIRAPNVRLEDMPRGWTNVFDIETAIELFAPVFQFLLTDSEFWRATQSLQLDETIGLYYAKLLGLSDRMFLVNNRHPMLPAPTGEAARRLVLHGLSTESLHALLMERKVKQVGLDASEAPTVLAGGSPLPGAPRR